MDNLLKPKPKRKIKCVPDYEELFIGDIDVRKKPLKVLTKIYKENWLKIVWTNILYILF